MELPSGRVLFNDNKVKMLGYTPDEFENAKYQDFMDLIHPDDYEPAMQAMRDHLDGKKELYEVEYRIRAKNGKYKWFYDRGSIVEKKKSNITVKGIVINISRLKDAENYEKLFHQVLEKLNKTGKKTKEIRDILFLIKDYTSIESVGFRLKQDDDYPYYESYGYPKKFIKQTSNICDKNKNPQCMCGYVLKGDINHKSPNFTASGSFFTNNLSKTIAENQNSIKKIFTSSKCIDSNYESIGIIPIKSNQNIIGLIQLNDHRKNMLSSELINLLEGIGSSIGISFNRDKILEELKINERRYALAQKAAEIGSWDWNILTGELIWSEKIEPMFGFSKNQFKGTYEAFLDSVHPDDRRIVIDAVNSSLKDSKKKYSIEHRIIYPNKQIRWVLEKGDVIRDDNGEPVRMLGVVQDITRKKELENELKEKRDDLEKIVNQRTLELKNTNKRLIDQINEREKAEKYILQTKQHLRNIIDSASELIITFDMNHRVTTWNKTVENLTKFKTIEILNRSVGKLDVFDNAEDINTIITTLCNAKKALTDNIVLRTKDKEKKIISITATDIKGGSNECLGVLFIGKDITYDLELHGKLLPGSSYYIPDNKLKSTLDLFLNVTTQGTNGLFITRSTPAVIQSIIHTHNNLDIFILSETDFKEYNTISDVSTLIKVITDFCKNHSKSIILLDGIHYLLTKFTFDTFIQNLYKINDIIAKHHAILLVRIDPSTLDSNQQAIIENELQLIPSRKIGDLTLDDDVYAILKFIYQENQLNALVSYKKVTQAFKIAYVTAASRLETLENERLIITKREGKHRTIYVTEKGKNIIHSRQMV